jgi:hypothetical protein
LPKIDKNGKESPMEGKLEKISDDVKQQSIKEIRP